MNKKIIFADIDGTLFDHETGKFRHPHARRCGRPGRTGIASFCVPGGLFLILPGICASSP